MERGGELANISFGRPHLLRGNLRGKSLQSGSFRADPFGAAQIGAVDAQSLEPIVQAHEVGEAHAAVHFRRRAGNEAADLVHVGFGKGCRQDSSEGSCSSM